MGVRESFLTIDEGTAAAPGPAHYSPSIIHSSIKGGSSLSNKVNVYIASVGHCNATLDTCRKSSKLDLNAS